MTPATICMMRSMKVPDMSRSLLALLPRIDQVHSIMSASRPSFRLLASQASVGLARCRDDTVCSLNLAQDQLVLHFFSFPLQAHPAQFADQLDELVGRSLFAEAIGRFLLVVRHFH